MIPNWSGALLMLVTVGAASCVLAGDEPFRAGPVITEFGKNAPVKSDQPVSRDTHFKVVFDVSKKADSGHINRTMDSAARFINMHVNAGVPADNIAIALVVHGGASIDVTDQAHYKSKSDDKSNATASAIATLLENNVEIYLCGQSAAAHGIDNDDLLPGVKMALSAMTAHALLQQQGFTLNPF